MDTIFAVYEVNRLVNEQLIGYFSTFEKAEVIAVDIAIDESMERHSTHLWVNPQSWGTVYIKESPVDLLTVI